MELTELSQDQFTAFFETHPQSTFLQSPCWGDLKHKNGWDVTYLGFVSKNQVIAGCMLLSKTTPIHRKMFYAPRGFLLDYEDFNLVRDFTQAMYRYVKKEKGIFFKIDPYILYHTRDRDGHIVEGGVDHSNLVSYLCSLGYQKQAYKIHQQTLQAKWMYTLTLEGKTLDQVLSEMDAKTRQMIHKNEKNGVIVRDGTREDISLFTDIMNETSSRREFLPRSYQYYLNMYDVFQPEGKFVLKIAEIHPKEQLKVFTEEKEKLLQEKDEKQKQHDAGTLKMKEEKYQKRMKELENQLMRLEEKIHKMQDIYEKHGEIVPIGAINYMLYGGEVLSFYGGAYQEFLSFQPFYSIHYEMIRYAVTHGYHTYNFYSIHGDLSPEDPMYGVYQFKRGFGGQVVELIGEFDYPVAKFWYFVYKVSYYVVHKLKRIKFIFHK